ncbi:MAG: hypothetical protein FJ009_13570 [Chloroflexi bacterium]|nr:hypothetical protein [Chloroflexota bacterium]
MEASFLINLIGWIGSAAVILAYVLVSLNRLRGDSVVYQLLNLLGGMFLIVNTIFWGAYPSTFVNFVWVCIALFALARIARR